MLLPSALLSICILSCCSHSAAAVCLANGTTKPLSPSEWAERLECESQANGRGEAVGNLWLSKHIDELANGTFKLLVRQESLEARMWDLIQLGQMQARINFQHFEFNSGDLKQDLLNQKLVAGAQVDDKVCESQLEQVLELLADLDAHLASLRPTGPLDELTSSSSSSDRTPLDERHFRLALQLDSFGRYQSGQLGGRSHSFGSYEQCIRSPLLLASRSQATNQTLVRTRFCWAHLGAPRHLSTGANKLTNSTTDLEGDTNPERKPKFHMAICLPAACHSTTLNSNAKALRLVQKLIDSQYRAPESIYPHQSLPLESVFCLVDGDSQFAAMSPAGMLFGIFVGLWLLVCICATSISRSKISTKLSPWNLAESWRDFLADFKSDRSGVNLDALNPIKLLSGLALFLVHAGLIFAPLNAAPIQMEASSTMSFIQRLTVPSLLLVDSFFVLLWTKVTFVLLEKLAGLEGNQARQNQPPRLSVRKFSRLWLQLSARLYLNLVPLYVLMFWFKKSLFAHLGSGPLWDFGLNKATPMGACQQETWLSPLLPLTAFTPIFGQCLPQSWLLSNELMLAPLLPPLVIMLSRQLRFASSLLATLITITNIALGYLAYSTMRPEALKLQLEQFRSTAPLDVFKEASYIYTIPCYRIPVAIVGVVAGYALFRYKQKLASSSNMQRSGWPNWFSGFATQNAIILVVVTLLMAFTMAEIGSITGPTFKRSLMKNFVLTGHFNWALANAVIFLRMSTDWKDRSYLLQLASSRLFRAAGKLTLAFWLVHWDLLMFSVQASGQSYSWSYAKTISMALLGATSISLLIHLVFENPANKLVKALYRGKLRPFEG